MSLNNINSALEPVIKAFDELGILYYIGGSLASSSYGVARSSLDVDFVSDLSLHHIQPLVDKLAKSFYIDAMMIEDAINNKGTFNLLHLESMLKIDVFILKDQVYFRNAFNRRITKTIDEDNQPLKLVLCSPEDIILIKLDWYRSGGELSERQWQDVAGVIKVQDKSLDKKYLTKWGEELGINDLLIKSFKECGIDI